MKIDAHQHFWKYTAQDYPWMDHRMKVIQSDHLPCDLKPLLDSIGFAGCIAVQARQSLEETEFLLDFADKNHFIKGVVGWVDLRAANVENQLDKYAAHPKFVGVRHVIHDEADDDFMLGDDFCRGISFLEKYQLSYDLLLFPKHLPNAKKLVAMFPRQTFVLDHIAKPLIAQQLFSPWQDDLLELASFPNVSCKLSGMVTEADWEIWQPEQITAYLDVVIAAFGAERCMIGSDWPVCQLAADYKTTMNLVIQHVRNLSADEKAGILGGNCARIYQLALR